MRNEELRDLQDVIDQLIDLRDHPRMPVYFGRYIDRAIECIRVEMRKKKGGEPGGGTL